MLSWGLTERAVLISGASRGLGAATARLLAAQGCRLALCARDGTGVRSFAEALADEFGVPVYAAAADVTDPPAVARFVDEAADRLGSLAGVVVNAGGQRGAATFAETADGDWADTFDLNVGHAARLVRNCLPHLVPATGSVVLVSSIAAHKPCAPAQYAVAKAALAHLAACLAREFGALGVRINSVSPGSMMVPNKRSARMRVEEPAGYERFLREFPAGALIEPDDVAAVIAFLLSDAARAVHGTDLAVDGGQRNPVP